MKKRDQKQKGKPSQLERKIHCLTCTAKGEIMRGFKSGAYDFTKFSGSPQYGSKHDFCSSHKLEFYICDDCLRERSCDIDIVENHPQPPKIKRAKWDPNKDTSQHFGDIESITDGTEKSENLEMSTLSSTRAAFNTADRVLEKASKAELYKWACATVLLLNVEDWRCAELDCRGYLGVQCRATVDGTRVDAMRSYVG